MKRTAIIAAFGLVLSGAASADDFREAGSRWIGPWKLQAWSERDRFDHCTLARKDGEVATVFALGQNGVILALASSEWKLEAKASYPVRLVGANLSRDIEAEATTAGAVTILLGHDANLIEAMKRVAAFDVRAASGTIRVPMDHGRAGLTELEACWREHVRPAAASGSNPFAPRPADAANPFAAKPANPSNPFAAESGSTDNPFAPRGRTLPVRPSLADYSVLMNRAAGRPVNSTVDKDGDFETAHGGQIKTMFSSRDGADDVGKLAEAFLNGAKPSCKGTPRTGTVTRDQAGSVRLQRIYLACTMSAPVYIDTVIVTDGVRFETYSTLGLQKDQAEIMRIGQAIFGQVRRTYD